MSACNNGNYEIVKLLIDSFGYSCTPECLTIDGESAFSLTCDKVISHGHINHNYYCIVKLLIDEFGDVIKEDLNGVPIISASKLDIVQEFLAIPTPNKLTQRELILFDFVDIIIGIIFIIIGILFIR